MVYFGIDWDGPLPSDSDDNIVEVPNIPNPLSTLCRNISPINDSGIDLFINVLHFVCQKLSIA